MNELVKALIGNSYLSETQIDVLLCRKYAEVSGLRLKDVLKLRQKHTTFASFDRSYMQATTVMKKCVLTLLLLDYFGLLEEDFTVHFDNARTLLKNFNKELANSSDIKSIIDKFVSGRLQL
ncbi:MAG: hypothetical protein QXV32_00765 [Conexivisphaerales archaeon]